MMNPGGLVARENPAGAFLFRNPAFHGPFAPRTLVGDGAYARERRTVTDRRIGIIFNQRAHGNFVADGGRPHLHANAKWASPRTMAELSDTLASFAEAGIDTLAIDGGDGTVRDVLTMAPRHFGKRMPQIAIIPSGKTNALAIDLGVPASTTLQDALASLASGRIVRRAPVEVHRDGDPSPLRGFLFGAGGFVKATELAQTTHRIGAFRGLAVGMALAAAIAQTLVGSRTNPWRRGERMVAELDGGARVDRDFYLLLASTLERMPLGLKPFGRVRAGLKLLAIDAPPRNMLTMAPALLAGSESDRLKRNGYHRVDFRSGHVSLKSGFVLDGEHYAGGDLFIKQGAALDFIVP